MCVCVFSRACESDSRTWRTGSRGRGTHTHTLTHSLCVRHGIARAAPSYHVSPIGGTKPIRAEQSNRVFLQIWCLAGVYKCLAGVCKCLAGVYKSQPGSDLQGLGFRV